MAITSQSSACAFVRKYLAAKRAYDELDAQKSELVPFIQENGTASKSGKSLEMFIAEHKAVMTPKTPTPSYSKAWNALLTKYPAIAEDAAAILAANTSPAKDGYSISFK